MSGERLGVPCTIVMPNGTPSIKVRNVARMGAKVVLHGADFAPDTPSSPELRQSDP